MTIEKLLQENERWRRRSQGVLNALLFLVVFVGIFVFFWRVSQFSHKSNIRSVKFYAQKSRLETLSLVVNGTVERLEANDAELLDDLKKLSEHLADPANKANLEELLLSIFPADPAVFSHTQELERF